MDDTPMDKSKKSAASNTESRLFSTEKDQEYDEDLRPTPNRSLSHDDKEFSESAQNREKLVKQDKMELRLSLETSERPSLPKPSDEIPGSSAASRRQMSDKSAKNSAKRHNSLNSTFCAKHKPKLTQATELRLQSRNEKTAEKCISSSDNLEFQGYFHVLGHTSYNKFKCDHCDKWFDYKENLKIHTLVHTEKRTFQCDVCGKEFSLSRDDLTKHKMIHTGRNLFNCPICGKQLKSKKALTYHKTNCVETAEE